MANEALLRRQKVVAVRETVPGELAFPATDGTATEIVATDLVTLNQDAPLIDIPEIRNSRDVINRIVGRRVPGSFTIPVLLRPPGTAGTAPQDDVLWESLLGNKTVNPGVSVVYSQNINKPSFSLWVKIDHTVFFAKGCVAESMSPTVDPVGGIALEWAGRYMLSGWCGQSEVSTAAASGATTVVVADAKRFSSGARIHNATIADTNGGAGYEVTFVDTATNTLTISTGIANIGGWSIGDSIEPYFPETTMVGSPAEGRKFRINFGDELNKPLNNISLTIGDPVVFVEELTEYPEGYIEDQRDINGTVTVYFRKENARYLYDAYEGTNVNVEIYNDAPVGHRFKFTMPRTSISVPQITANAPAVMLDIGIKALGTAGEDSLTVTFE